MSRIMYARAHVLLAVVLAAMFAVLMHQGEWLVGALPFAGMLWNVVCLDIVMHDLQDEGDWR